MRSPSQRANARYRTEAGFTETVTIGTFERRTNTTTGRAERVLVAEEYAGRAQIVLRSLVVGQRSAASQDLADQTPMIKLPSGTVVSIGAEVLTEASDADPSLAGTRYKIDGRPQAGQTTAARYPLEILT